MTVTDVIEVLDCLKQGGIRVCVDGGWGVDALLGEQTRDHSDLDLALDGDDLDAARQALEEQGFQHDESSDPGLPARLVLRDDRGRQVDLHPLVFDERGDGWQQLSATGRAWGRYPGDDLDAIGIIGGQRVRCLSAQLQARFRMGYELTECDEHDLHLLGEQFGVPNPPGLQKSQSF
jgi:lincosamide nucleotidyltransferase A/C/D/E